MKRLMYLCLMFMTLSCSDTVVGKNEIMVISNIEKVDQNDTVSKYTVKGLMTNDNLLHLEGDESGFKFSFFDSDNKFSVGDTVIFKVK